jgi:tetratricopeptide (TPR) repeat protein
MSTTASLTASGLKDQGNELFGKKEYRKAISKFTLAIELDGDAIAKAILFANRAACHLALKRYSGSLLITLWNDLLFSSCASSYQQVLDDAKKVLTLAFYHCLHHWTHDQATELDPKYAKAWYRLGIAHDVRAPLLILTNQVQLTSLQISKALENYPESIESYQQALTIVQSSNAPANVRQQIETGLNQATTKTRSPETMYAHMHIDHRSVLDLATSLGL